VVEMELKISPSLCEPVTLAVVLLMYCQDKTRSLAIPTEFILGL